MRTPWQVDGGDIERLQANSPDFVRLVNALLSAQGRAGKLPDAAVQLNQQDMVPDGGVDAVVSQAISAGLDPTGWFDVSTCWQFKAQPTSNIKHKEGGGQEAALRAEIRKPFSADLVKKGHGYRLCIADDMPANRKTEWEGWLDDEAKKIHPDAKPAKVLTASDLASWVNRYPAVVLRLRPTAAGMKPMASWQDEVRALTSEFVRITNWDAITSAIRDHVDFGRKVNTVLTAQGEAGVGKTRAVCEALASDPALEGLVAATSDEEAALAFAGLIASDRHTRAILVADECSLAYRERLRRMLPGCADRLRVIAIDNSLQRAGMAGEIAIPQMSRAEVDAVLARNFPDLPADRRRSFVHLASGFVRLAVDLCQHNDLVPPDGRISSVFGLFHDSYLTDRLDDEELAAVQVVSLLPRVGYREDVADQLAQLCAHPVINRDPQRVVEVANRLKQAPGFIAFAGRFLYVTPMLIAQVAFQSAWDRWVESDPPRFLNNLPPELLDGFVERGRQAQNPTLATVISDFFLQWASGLAPPDLRNEAAAVRLARLVETRSDLFLPLLKGLLDRTPAEELRRLHTKDLEGQNARRQFVWLGEKLCRLRETFPQGEALLLRLALAETEHHLGNSASRVWASLYRIGLSGTPIPFSDRLTLLEKRLREADASQLPLAVAAFDETLTDGPGMALSAPVVLGRIPPPTWRPEDGAALQACRRAGMEMAARLAAEGGPVAEALCATVIGRLAPLVLAGCVDQVEAVVGPGPLPDHLLTTLRRELDNFIDTFCREHVYNVMRKRALPDGKEEALEVEARYPRKVSPEIEARVREWLRRLIPPTLHGRLVSAVGRDPWQQESDADHAAWQQELNSLAAEFHGAPDELKRELPWLASSEARSNFHLGQAMAKIDGDGALLDTMLLTVPLAGATGAGRGYLDGLIASHPELLDRANESLDLLQDDSPSAASDVVWGAGAAVRKVERVFQMIDGGVLPPEAIRGLEYDVHNGRMTREQLSGALERAAAAEGNTKAAAAAVRLLYAWLHPDRKTSGIDRLRQDEALRPLVLRALTHSVRATGGDPTFWLTLADDLAEFEPAPVVELMTGALTSRDQNMRALAQEHLTKLARRYPDLVMAALGAAFLNPETNVWLHMADLSDLIQALPVPVVQGWIQNAGVDAARAVARHLPPPHIDGEGRPQVPALTDWVLQQFEGENKVFREFASGTHAGQVYSGDLAAQYEQEGQVARHFINHPVRRVREWALAEIAFARERADFWRRRDEEDFAD